MMFKRIQAKMRSMCGFTLVELVVSMMILGTLAAVTVPSLTGYITRGKQDTIITEARAAVAAAQSVCSSKYQAGGFSDPAEILRTWYGSDSAGSPNTFGEEYHILADSETTGSGSLGSGSTALSDVNAVLHGTSADGAAAPSNVVSGSVTDFTCDSTGKVTWLVYQSGDVTVVYSAGGTGIGGAGTATPPPPTDIPLPTDIPTVKITVVAVDENGNELSGDATGTVSVMGGSLSSNRWSNGSTFVDKQPSTDNPYSFTVTSSPAGYEPVEAAPSYTLTDDDINSKVATAYIHFKPVATQFELRIHAVDSTDKNRYVSGAKLKITGDGLGSVADSDREWTSGTAAHVINPKGAMAADLKFTVDVDTLPSGYTEIDPNDGNNENFKVECTLTAADITNDYADIYLCFVPVPSAPPLTLSGHGVSVTISNVATWPANGGSVTYERGQYIYHESTKTYYVVGGGQASYSYNTSGKAPDDILFNASLFPVKAYDRQLVHVWRDGTVAHPEYNTGFVGLTIADIYVAENNAVYLFNAGGDTGPIPSQTDDKWVSLFSGSTTGTGTGVCEQTFTVSQAAANTTITPVYSGDTTLQLSGAKLYVKNPEGKIVAIWTSTDAQKQLSLYLANGNYYTITEDAGGVPANYAKAEDTPFVVSGSATALVPHDLMTGTLQVTLCDGSGATLTGQKISFNVTGNAVNGKPYTQSAEIAGSGSLQVSLGTYTFIDFVPPAGYAVDRIDYGTTNPNVAVSQHYTPPCKIYCYPINDALTFRYAGNANKITFPNRTVALISSAQTLPTSRDGTPAPETEYKPDKFIYQAPTNLADLFNGTDGVQLIFNSNKALSYTPDQNPDAEHFTVTNPEAYKPESEGSCTLTILYNKSAEEVLRTTLTVRTFDYQQPEMKIDIGKFVFPYALDYQFYQIRADDNKTGTYIMIPDGAAILKNNLVYLCCNDCAVDSGKYPNWLTSFGSLGKITATTVITDGSEYLESDNDTVKKEIPAASLYYDPANRMLYETRLKIAAGKSISALINSSAAENAKPANQISYSNIFILDVSEWGWRVDLYNALFHTMLEDSDLYLAGIQYTLTDPNGTPVYSWTSGTTLEPVKLDPGVYTLTETLPSGGNYVPSASAPPPQSITIPVSSNFPQSVNLYYSFHLNAYANFTEPNSPLQPKLRVDRIEFKTISNVRYGYSQASYEKVMTDTSLPIQLKLVTADGADKANDGTLNIRLNQRYYLSEFECDGDYVRGTPLSFTVKIVAGVPKLMIYQNNNNQTNTSTIVQDGYDLVITNTTDNLYKAMAALYSALNTYVATNNTPSTTVLSSSSSLLDSFNLAPEYKARLTGCTWSFRGNGTASFNDAASAPGLSPDNSWRLHFLDQGDEYPYFCTGGTYGTKKVFLCQIRSVIKYDNGKIQADTPSRDQLLADAWFIAAPLS